MKVQVDLILWNYFLSLTVLISYVGFRAHCAKFFRLALTVNGDVTCTAFVSLNCSLNTVRLLRW